MRDIDEIQSDLEDALEELHEQEAEVCHATMNRDDAKGWVEHYKKELEEVKDSLVT